MREEKAKPRTFTRQELYDLAWSEPMYTLATNYAISDRGLAKACLAADIPVPERGYWNKLNVGKKVCKRALPPRGLGQSDEVTIGANPWGYHDSHDLLREPIPPPPVFATPMEAVRTQV